MLFTGPKAHPQITFLNMRSRRQIMYFAPVRDIDDGVGGLSYLETRTPQNILLSTEPKQLANAFLMIDYKAFFAEAKPILDGAGKSAANILEELNNDLTSSIAGTTAGIARAAKKNPDEELVGSHFMNALMARTRTYQKPEFLADFLRCLTAHSKGEIDTTLKTAICQVICDVDLEHRTQYYRRLINKVVRKKETITTLISNEKKHSQDDYSAKWGLLCTQIIQAFTTICTSAEISSSGICAQAFSDAFAARLGQQRSYIPEVAGLGSAWRTELKRDVCNTFYLQALEGLAFAEADQIHKHYQSKIGSSVFDKSSASDKSSVSGTHKTPSTKSLLDLNLSVIMDLPSLDFELACENDEIAQKQQELWRIVYREARTPGCFYDTSKLEMYVAEICELTGMPNSIEAEKTSKVKLAAYIDLKETQKQKDFNLYLHHRAVKAEWQKMYFATSPRSFPEVLCAVLWGMLYFDHKHKSCSRCHNLFFYSSPHQTHCSRWYRGTDKTCTTVEGFEAKDCKNLAAINGQIQKLKKRAQKGKRASRNPHQEELAHAFIQWAQECHDLAENYIKDDSINAELYHEWVKLIYPLKSTVDEENVTFPHYIIKDDKVVDRNTLGANLTTEAKEAIKSSRALKRVKK